MWSRCALYKYTLLACALKAHIGTVTLSTANLPGMDHDELGVENLGVPNCDVCLEPLELSGTTESPYWYCTSCKVARLT